MDAPPTNQSEVQPGTVYQVYECTDTCSSTVYELVQTNRLKKSWLFSSCVWQWHLITRECGQEPIPQCQCYQASQATLSASVSYSSRAAIWVNRCGIQVGVLTKRDK